MFNLENESYLRLSNIKRENSARLKDMSKSFPLDNKYDIKNKRNIRRKYPRRDKFLENMAAADFTEVFRNLSYNIKILVPIILCLLNVATLISAQASSQSSSIFMNETEPSSIFSSSLDLRRGRAIHSKTYNYNSANGLTAKACNLDGREGTCMFVWQCIKDEGEHMGMCMDGFMFGSCCNTKVAGGKYPNAAGIHTVAHGNTGQSTPYVGDRNATSETKPVVHNTISPALIADSTVISTFDLPHTPSWTRPTERPFDRFTTRKTTKFKRPKPPVAPTRPTRPPKPVKPNKDWWYYPDGSSIKHTLPPKKYSPTTPKTTTTSTTTPPATLWEISPLTTSTTTTTTSTTQQPPSARAACGVPQIVNPEGRIVNGSTSLFGRWPWQVSIRRISFFGLSSVHRCGGALLNERWVATAGHCVDDLLVAQIRVRLGEYDFSSTSEPMPHMDLRVITKIVHPKYDFFSYEYDLALLKVERKIKFEPHIAPICLPGNSDLLVGEKATVTGWGRLSEHGTLPNKLQQASVPIMSNEECRGVFARGGRTESIPGIFLCAGYEKGGTDSCQGDSGGPLQVLGKDGRYFLAGIISWGIGCAEANLPGVCTRISYFVDYILGYVTS